MMKRSISMYQNRKDRQTSSLGKARILLAALALTGAFVVPSVAQAAVQTKPMVVTDKDKVIDDDFDIHGHTYATAIYVDKASTGTVQVNSNTVHVENVGQAKQDTGVIDTGYGWTGKLNLKSGMQISGDFSGTAVWARGIQLNGFQNLTETDDTGNPYAGTAYLGDNVSVSLTGNHATDSAGFYGIEVDGENLQAGNGLTSSVSAHTGSNSSLNPADSGSELLGLQVVHYGTVQIGDHAAIKVYNRIEKDSPHMLSEAIETVHNWNTETYDTPAKGRQKLTIGKDAVISSEADNNRNFTITGGDVDGIRLSHTDFSLGDGAQITTKTTGAMPNQFGIYTDYHTQAVIGNDMTNTVTAEGRVPFVIGIQVKNDKYEREVDETVRNTLTIGERGKTIVSSTGDGNIYTRGIDIIGGQVILKDDNILQVFGKNTHAHGNTAYTDGVRLTEQGSLKAGNNLQLTAQAINGTQLYGLEQNNSIITIGNHFTNTLQAFDTNEPDGVLSVNSQLTIGDDSLNEVQVKGEAPDFWITGYDTVGKTADGSLNLKLGNRARTSVSYEGNAAHQLQLFGVYNKNALSQIGDDAFISASAPALPNSYIYGLFNDNGQTIIGRNAAIQAQSLGGKRSYGIYNVYGTTELGDDASVLLDTTATQNAAVFSAAKGNVIFDGGMKVQTGADQDALSAKVEGIITAIGEGTKQIHGNLLTAGSGTINLKLGTPDSLLRGKSAVESAKDLSGSLSAGTTDLTISNGARWDMTGSSTVTSLTHENGGIVNMEYNPSYQKLEVGNYTGRDGLFLMKTDLDSQTEGDKVHMVNAADGSQGKIQVEDSSFLTGKEVTGNRHLLLVTDDSMNATFTGKTLDKGGLWDVTPTIQNGKYVREVMGYTGARDTEWYLTKLHRSINESTKTLLHSTDNTYALYRNSVDTLRQRMGDLRFRNKKEDVSGLWARDTHGAYGGSGVYSKYNRLQLGYDYAANEKSIYGFLFERGIGNPRYENGRSKDHTFAGALYGTWFGDNGSYTDVVAKVGRDDTSLHSYGQYPDSASFRTREESLSVEYGRTHTLNDKGFFLEPQAQMVFGHLDSKDYTTARGKTVHMDSFNSAIGRIGLLLGQRKTEGNHPFDYYAKVSVLHEFGGNRDYYLTAPDGETMNTSEDYRDTWYEAGFGGTYRINGSTYLYADGEREFGGKWNRKWQWNVGIHWQF